MEDSKLVLFVPDWSELDTLRKSRDPFCLWEIGNRPLLFHWLDWSVSSKEFKQIEIHTADRPHEVRESLGGGAFWSINTRVHPVKNDNEAPDSAVRVSSLPERDQENPQQPEELLNLWLRLNMMWLDAYSSGGPQIMQKLDSGAWVGPGAAIHESVMISPPVWIGARCEVGKGCRLGPGAIVRNHSILDEDVEVENAVILPNSYVGAHVGVKEMVVEGGKLMDVNKGVRVDIAESFILAPVERRHEAPSWMGRVLAMLALVILAIPAFLRKRSRICYENILLNNGQTIDLSEGSSGPLALRRWSWLFQIVLGRFHWFGILPRNARSLEKVPKEAADQLRSAPIGFFSLADAHGVHSVDEEDEWLHAAYQSLADRREVRQLLLKNLKRLWN